jgi:hypothetical protein
LKENGAIVVTEWPCLLVDSISFASCTGYSVAIRNQRWIYTIDDGQLPGKFELFGPPKGLAAKPDDLIEDRYRGLATNRPRVTGLNAIA